MVLGVFLGSIHLYYNTLGLRIDGCGRTKICIYLWTSFHRGRPSEGLEPHIRVIDMVVLVHHDHDSFWRMQSMEMSLDKDDLERYSPLTSTSTPAKVILQGVD